MYVCDCVAVFVSVKISSSAVIEHALDLWLPVTKNSHMRNSIGPFKIEVLNGPIADTRGFFFVTSNQKSSVHNAIHPRKR